MIMLIVQVTLLMIIAIFLFLSPRCGCCVGPPPVSVNGVAGWASAPSQREPSNLYHYLFCVHLAVNTSSLIRCDMFIPAGESSLSYSESLFAASGAELPPSLLQPHSQQNFSETAVVWPLSVVLGWAWDWLGGSSAAAAEAARLAAIEEHEKHFHNLVREHIICLLVFISLYLLSYWCISRFKARSDHDSLYAGDEDYFVYRISIWMCTVSLAVSLGSIALLPFSVLGAELLQRYPSSFYLNWLSWQLMHSLWNYVFAVANLSLFVLLPFSYFFIESQGFSKRKNGIMQRVYETLAVCGLLVVLLLCLADVVLSVIGDGGGEGGAARLSVMSSLASLNLPLLYSFVSLVGVLLLLVTTPVGMARMFTLVNEWGMVALPDVDEMLMSRLERSCQRRRANGGGGVGAAGAAVYPRETGGDSLGLWRRGQCSPQKQSPRLWRVDGRGGYNNNDSPRDSSPESLEDGIEDGAAGDAGLSYLEARELKMMPLRQKSLRWYQHVLHTIKFPAAVALLLAATAICVLMVAINTLKLLFGYRGLPEYAQYMEVHHRHTFGLLGVAMECGIIVYIMCTSLVGVYCLPWLGGLRPRRQHTSMTAIIGNCLIVLVLSSALPVLANTLGITSFDLLGAYGSLSWLQNFGLVLTYNVAFAAAAMLCLVNKFTAPVRQELMRRLNELRCRRREQRDDYSEKIE